MNWKNYDAWKNVFDAHLAARRPPEIRFVEVADY